MQFREGPRSRIIPGDRIPNGAVLVLYVQREKDGGLTSECGYDYDDPDVPALFRRAHATLRLLAEAQEIPYADERTT